MAVPVVAREQAIERVDEVVVGACPGLDDGDARGGVRREHVAETVAAPGTECTELVGEIDDPVARRVDIEDHRVHSPRAYARAMRRRVDQ